MGKSIVYHVKKYTTVIRIMQCTVRLDVSGVPELGLNFPAKDLEIIYTIVETVVKTSTTMNALNTIRGAAFVIYRNNAMNAVYFGMLLRTHATDVKDTCAVRIIVTNAIHGIMTNVDVL